MATLNAAQRQQLALELKRFPDKAEEILAALEAKGYQIDRAEFQPISWGAEADVAARSAVKGATLGLVDPGESPLAAQAGDIALPGLGEVRPAAGIGSLLGILLPGSAALKAGRALVPGATLGRGVAQEAVAGGLFGAGESAAQVARGAEVTGEEALGTMVADAAGFAALGLIGRGVLKLFQRAAAKQAAGQPLESAEEDAVKQVTALMVVRQPLGPRSQLPEAPLSGPVMGLGQVAGRPGIQELPGGYQTARRQLPPSSESGLGTIPLPSRPALGPRRQLPASTESTLGTIGLPGERRTLLPRFTPETADAVAGKPPEVIRLERKADELYRRLEAGDITTPQAMQAFQLLIERGVPAQQQALVNHRAREAFRRAEGPGAAPGERPGLPSAAGAPATADPLYPQVEMVVPVPRPGPHPAGGPAEVVARIKMTPQPQPLKPKRPARLPAQMTPYQVLRRFGGLRDDALERLQANLPQEAGWHRMHLAKLRGGRQDAEAVLADIRESEPVLAQVFEDAGINNEDDLIRAIRNGDLWKKQSIRPRQDQATREFAERPLDWDPSVEGFEQRIPAARSWDELEIEVQRLDDAALFGGLSPEESAQMVQLISERARLIAEPKRPPLEMQPTSPTGAPPRPREENMPLSLGDQRQLPGMVRTSGTARMEGTPLDQAVENVKATQARAAAPQGNLLEQPPAAG